MSAGAAPGIDRAEVLRRIDQADVALGCAGLGEQDILRSELREARATIATLIDASPKGGRTNAVSALEAYEAAAANYYARIGDDRYDDTHKANLAAEVRRTRAALLNAMQPTRAEVGA